MNNNTPNIRKMVSQVVVFAVVASLLLAMPRSASACGPFFTDAIFVYKKHPDFPLARFAEGKIGVLQPSYARSYLFAAYRNFIGVGFSATEEKALTGLWEDRLNYAGEIDDSAWVKTWLTARAKVPGLAAPAEIHAFRNREKPHEYETFVNCQQDAFETAAATLDERVKRFGADNAAVHDWVLAQDTVFANCSEGKHIPEAAAASADAFNRADRAYQIAAANFYAGAFDDAKQQFEAIAADHGSPWQDRGAYLAARAMLRKGSLADKEEDGRPALASAETRLKEIFADAKLASVRHAAQRLLNLVRLRLHPEDKLHEIARSIVKTDASADLKQDVWDYTKLLDDFVGDDSDDAAKKTVPATIRTDEVTDWILTFADESAGALNHSLERWEKTNSLPWLVSSIAKMDGQNAKSGSLLAAAAKLDHASPAFAMLTVHSVRLLMESNRNDEARRMLDQTLGADRSRLPASTVNLLLGERMRLSRNLDELLQSAQRLPAGFSDDSDGREIPLDDKKAEEFTKEAHVFFDLEVANTLNKAVPVSILKDAALAKALPPNLRGDVAQAAFLRAALLGSDRDALQTAPVLQSFYPQLKPYLEAYERASSPDSKLFAAIYIALKFPGLRPYVSAGIGRTTPLQEIDSYRDNWWCAEAPSSPLSPPAEESADTPKPKQAKPVQPPEFLAGSVPVAAKQIAALQALGSAPDYLCRTVIDWANKNPADPRVPEALHLAVKSTRYGCTDKETGRWSKAAYDLLHARYQNSTWAKQTKYWFKD
jgi:hypothetical protein